MLEPKGDYLWKTKQNSVASQLLPLMGYTQSRSRNQQYQNLEFNEKMMISGI